MAQNSDININKLKEVLRERGETFEGLSLNLGINRSTLFRKLKRGREGITLRDYLIIKKSLKFTPKEAGEIFWRGVNND